ncbi:MAG TPA: hypothetical protein VGQ96_02380, partial [Candidatus Eremiobacteraceae bacterium]|nr:hypothetical protein [Candidatus Eremiobacteraceae bacterium]
ELSFALQNTTQNGAKVASVAVYADKATLGTTRVAVTAAAGQTSEVMSVALKTSEDPLKYKDLMLNFLDDSKKMIGSVKLDAPALETIFTSLDEKHPKGLFSIDSVEISHIGGGKSTQFECTFALTNASAAAVSVNEFAIKPPKGDAVKIAIPLGVPARSASGFISIVVPYNGKSLPAGNYSVSALQNGTTAAKASAVLL